MLKKERENLVLALTYSLAKNDIPAKTILKVFEDLDKFNPELRIRIKSTLPTQRAALPAQKKTTSQL